jgi:hypothetical protein
MTPTLWANIGFDGFGINRIDYRNKEERKASQQLEFVWRGSRSLGSTADMWIHVMDSHCTVSFGVVCSAGYCHVCPTNRCLCAPRIPDSQTVPLTSAPMINRTYCWEGRCVFFVRTFLAIPPVRRLLVQNDPKLPTLPTNIQQQAEAFAQMAWDRSTWYRHNNLLIPFGDDFTHQNAQRSFVQMDKLMAAVNGNESYGIT